MENSNLLDDSIWSEDRMPIRTPKLIRLENICLIGYSLFFLLSIWRLVQGNFVSYTSWAGYMLINVAIIGGLFWWQKLSKEYDFDSYIQEFKLPKLLIVLRVFMGIFLVYSIYNILSFVFLILSGSVPLNSFSFFEWIWVLGMQIIGIGVDFLLAYYLYITNKIEKAIL